MDARIEKVLNWPAYQRALLVLVIMALIGAGFYFLIYADQKAEYANLESRKASETSKLRKNQKMAAELEDYKAQYENLQKEFEAALVKLPKQKEIPNLLTNIGELASEQGLEILTFKPGNEVPKGFYAEVPVSLEMIGSYHQVALFFEAVGNMSRIVNIQNLTLDNPKNQKGQTVLSVDCRATTFRFVENPPEAPRKGKKKKGR